MATRQTMREELERRVGDTTNAIWTDGEWNGFIAAVVTGLYPTFHLKAQGTTTAGSGPVQPLPAGARNIYAVDCQLVGSTRTRPILEWSEGSGNAVLPVSGIAGATLIWSWTKGFTPPTDDTTTLDLVPEAEEYVLLKAHTTALDKLLSSRTHLENFRVLQSVREGVSAEDINSTLRDLRAAMQVVEAKAPPLPQLRKLGA